MIDESPLQEPASRPEVCRIASAVSGTRYDGELLPALGPSNAYEALLWKHARRCPSFAFLATAVKSRSALICE